MKNYMVLEATAGKWGWNWGLLEPRPPPGMIFPQWKPGQGEDSIPQPPSSPWNQPTSHITTHDRTRLPDIWIIPIPRIIWPPITTLTDTSKPHDHDTPYNKTELSRTDLKLRQQLICTAKMNSSPKRPHQTTMVELSHTGQDEQTPLLSFIPGRKKY